MRKLFLTFLASILGLLSAPTSGAERVAPNLPLAHFVRWEGGPLELKRRQLLGQFSSNNPRLAEAIRQWYSPRTFNNLKEADINGIWLTWSVGLSEQEEEKQDAAATAYISKCNRAGIAVLATVSAGQVFLSTEEAATVHSKILRDPHGKPILSESASNLAAPALQCYQPDLRDADWKAQVLRRSSAAINAGADGVILEGLSSHYYEGKLVADFCNEVQRSLNQFVSPTAAGINANNLPRKPSGPLVLPLLSSTCLGQRLETPWLILESEAQPGVRPTTASLVNGEIMIAGASQSPWIDSNLWLLNCAHAFSPGKPLFLTYTGTPVTAEPSLISKGALQLAVAEAAALGSSSVLVLEDSLREGLFQRKAESLDEWNALAGYKRFFRSHPELMQMTTVHNTVVVVDGCEHSAELLNLMTRRRLLYDIIPSDMFFQTPLEPYTLLIIHDLPRHENDFSEKMMSLVRRGGVVVTSSASLATANQLKSFQQVEEDGERIIYSNGKGRWVVYRSAFPDPDTFANEMRRLLGTDLQPVRMWNSSAVLAHLTHSPDSNLHALHLLNYGIEAAQNLQVQVKGSFRKGEILSPDLPASAPLALNPKPGGTEFTIPSLGIYALVLLE